ncbi:MAG: hypothetical protein MI974_05620 [Chitinophagales bacterium]|nr:hypothetical protein [Chitinophagales bacterium]
MYTDLKDFIVSKELELQQNMKDKLLLLACKRRKLDSLFIKETEKIQSKLGQQEVKNGVYYEYQYWLSITKYDHPYSIQTSKKFQPSLMNLMKYLDNYYFHHRMILVLELAHRRKIENNTTTPFNHDQLIEAIRELGPKASITLRLLLQLYDAVTKEDYSRFGELKKLVFEYIHSFSVHAKRVLYAVFKDYTVWCYYNRAINAADLFDVIRFEIEEGLLIHYEYISRRTFVNAITISCAAKEYNWAKQFIQAFSCYLKEEIRENVISLSSANILFHQKKFEAAFKLLARVDFKSVSDKIVGRSLQLRIYYELKEFLALDAYMKSTLQYIRKEKAFSAQYIANYSLFVKAIKELKKLSENASTSAIEQFALNYCQSKEIFYREWILEKYKEIAMP